MAVAVEAPTIFAAPGQDGSVVELKGRYENFIGGEWVAPSERPVPGEPLPRDGRGVLRGRRLDGAEDVELALDAAHAAKDEWGVARPRNARQVLNEIADAIEANLEMLAVAESWENGKPVRETLAADLPLAIDHFRYFAGRRARSRRARSPRSTRRPSPTTSTSRSAWSGRSSRSTSRC